MDSYKKIRLARYSLLISPEDELILPSYKGSTLRGGFGAVFRRISCMSRNFLSCKDCLLKEKCAYSYIFETSPLPDSPVLKNIEDIPRPFIIEPPLETKRIYSKDDSLQFNLVLVGQAINFLPYFIVTFRELGKIGIGRRRKKFILREIRSHSLKGEAPVLIYSGEDNIARNVGYSFSWDEIIQNSRHLRRRRGKELIFFNFFTPTRLKYKSEYVASPEFHVLLRNLLRRIANLSFFHCGTKLNLDFKGLIERAQEIRIDKINLEWVDWERYSTAKRMRMKLGGFVGQVAYRGEFDEFMPYLLLGEYTHVGKGATFGLGWYKILD